MLSFQQRNSPKLGVKLALAGQWEAWEIAEKGMSPALRKVKNVSYCSAAVRLAHDCKDGAAFIGYIDVKELAAHSSITDCFWNSDLEGPSVGIARKSPAKVVISAATGEQLKDAVFLENAGWEVSSVPNEKVWLLESGKLPRIHLP